MLLSHSPFKSSKRCTLIKLVASISDKKPALPGEHNGYVRIKTNCHLNYRADTELTAIVARHCKGLADATSVGDYIILAAECGQGRSNTQLLRLGERFIKKLSRWFDQLPEADQMSYIETLEVPEAVYSFVGVAGSHREP
jgi:hypothetical protein